jgi:hypothetical protein
VPPVVLRLPLVLLLFLAALLFPAAIAGAQEPAPGASIAQDEDSTGDESGDDGTTAGVDENDTNGDGSITCEDFSTQDEAQIFFDDNSTDEDLVLVLDDDGDGIACEILDEPAGGVSTGDGGTAVLPAGPDSEGGSGSASGAVLVLVALLTAAGGITLLRRRPLGR